VARDEWQLVDEVLGVATVTGEVGKLDKLDKQRARA